MPTIARLLDLRADPRPLLELIGQIVVSASRDAFRAQRLGKSEWRERHVPNLAGIVSDLLAGRTPHEDRFTARPAGIDTGRLRDSVAARVEPGPEGPQLEVGSTLEYAQLIHGGGTTTQPVTSAVVRGARKIQEKRPDLKPGALDRILTLGELVTEVPARPIVGWTEEVAAEVRETIEEYLRS